MVISFCICLEGYKTTNISAIAVKPDMNYEDIMGRDEDLLCRCHCHQLVDLGLSIINTTRKVIPYLETSLPMSTH